jgi:hypothetical protein
MKGSGKEIRDPDLRYVEIALRRAGARARELGRKTGTPVFVFRNGKIVDLTAEDKKLTKKRGLKPSED